MSYRLFVRGAYSILSEACGTISVASVIKLRARHRGDRIRFAVHVARRDVCIYFEDDSDLVGMDITLTADLAFENIQASGDG